MSDYEQNTLDQLADMNYLVKLEEISVRARPTIQQDLKINNKFTKEMMEQYGKLYNQPIERIDPDTGEIQKYKYQRPVEDVPELEQLDPTLEHFNPNYDLILHNNERIDLIGKHLIAESDAWEKEKERIKDDLKPLMENFKSLKDEKQHVESLIGIEQYKITNIIGSKKKIVLVEKRQIERHEEEIIRLVKIIKNINKELEKITREIDKIKNFEERRNNFIEDAYAEINNLQQENADEKEKENDYISERDRVSKINKERIAAHQNILNTLNSGAFKMEQAQGETEEEYLKRLNDNAETPYTENILFGSIIDTIEKFKKNFKDITVSNTIIEAVLNSLSNEQRFLVNKYWGDIRRKLLNIYAFNNKSVTYDDYLETINKILNEKETTNLKTEYNPKQILKQQKAGMVEEQGAVVEHKEAEPEQQQIDIAENVAGNKIETVGDLEFMQMGDVVLIHSGTTNKDIFIKLGTISSKYKIDKVILVSVVNEEGSFNVLLGTSSTVSKEKKHNLLSFRNIMDILGISGLTLYEDIFNVSNEKDFKDKAWDNFKTRFTLEPKIRPVAVASKKLSENLTGWGIHHEEIPKMVDFGNIKIMLNKLYYQNILSIKDKNGKSIFGCKNTPVSDKFVDNIMKNIKNVELTKQDINLLPSNEVEIYDSLLVLGKLHKKHENNIDKTVENIKKRIEIVEGEIESGNNNQSLLKELGELLLKLCNYGSITRKQMDRHLTEIAHDYF